MENYFKTAMVSQDILISKTLHTNFIQIALLNWIVWGKNYVILRLSIWTILLITEEQANQIALQTNKDKQFVGIFKTFNFLSI